MKRGALQRGFLAGLATAVCVVSPMLHSVARGQQGGAATPAATDSSQASEPDAAARPIALEEALDLARRNAPQSVQAEGELRASRAGLRSAYASFLPSVSLSAGSTRQYRSGSGTTRIENGQVITVPDEPWSQNASVGANVTLFDGGRRFFDLRQARAGIDAAEANQITEEFGLALQVKTRYYEVLAARESEAAALSQMEQAEAQLRSVLARLQARTATRSDSLRSVIQMRNAELEILSARQDLAVASATLTRTVGSVGPVTARPEIADPAPTLAVDDEELRRLAEGGPAIRRAEATRDAAAAAAKSAWTDYLPALSASYSRSGSGSGSDFGLGNDLDTYSGSLRFSLSLPIFDQLRREEQVVRARVAKENSEAALRDARLASIESLTRSLGAFRSAGQRVSAQTASVQAAEEDLRVQQQRYALGSSTLLDVLTSQTQLNQAREDLILARHQQRIAKAELEALVGREL